MLTIKGNTPGLGRLLILAAWHELIGSCLLLIGSAIYLGGGLDNASTAGILWIIGAWIFLVGLILLSVINMVIGSVTALMTEMMHRQRAWFSVGSTMLFTFGMLLFTIGAAALAVTNTPGFTLFGSILWICAAAMWMWSFLVRGCGAWYYFVPVLSFATATAATSGLVAGSAAQPGLVGAEQSAYMGNSKMAPYSAPLTEAAPVAVAPIPTATGVPTAAPMVPVQPVATAAAPMVSNEQVHVAV